MSKLYNGKEVFELTAEEFDKYIEKTYINNEDQSNLAYEESIDKLADAFIKGGPKAVNDYLDANPGFHFEHPTLWDDLLDAINKKKLESKHNDTSNSRSGR